MGEGCNEIQLNHEKRLAEVEQSTKSAHHRIDEIQENTKILIEMNGNIRVLAEETKTLTKQNEEQNKKIDKIEGEVSTLKNKPGQYWEKMVSGIIVAIASSFVTACVALLMKK